MKRLSSKTSLMQALVRATALFTALSLVGCASIVSKSNWPVTVQSNPAGAKCVVSKANGIQLQSGTTPMTLMLNSSDGFFQSAKYILSCEKDGCNPSRAEFSASLNGWYWGNIVFGGLIGLIIVDPATGAMWKLDEMQVVNLELSDAKKEINMPGELKKNVPLYY